MLITTPLPGSEAIVNQMKEKWVKEGEQASQTLSSENPTEQTEQFEENTPVDSQEALLQSSPQHATGVEESKEEAPVERNIRIMRELKKKAERERDEAVRRMQELESYRQQAPQQQQEAPVDDDVNLNPDDLVEWKHVQKKMRKLEDQLRSYQQQTSVTTVEARLKYQYNDFDQVVSADNIELLKASYPELAQTLNDSKDLYAKAVSAYTLIKKLGINAEEYTQDKQMAQKNAAKPRPLTSVSPQQGSSPLSKANAFANGLTDELRKQLAKEMYEARKSM